MSLVGLRRLGLLLFSLCFWVPVQAAVDASLYQAEVPVASYSPEDWQKALAPALQQVLAKVSGNPNITQGAAVRKAMAKPSSMVQTFTYADHADNAGKKTLMLQVRFSTKAIDSLLQNAGQAGGAVSPVTPATNNPLAAGSIPAAVPSQNTTLHSINMVISGIRGLQDYTALLDYVRHLRGVLEVNSKQTQGDRVLLVVKTDSAMADLAKIIESENKLVKESLGGAATSADSLLSYRWAVDIAAVPANTGVPAQPAAEAPRAPSTQPLPLNPQSLPAVPEGKQLLPRSSLAAPVVEGIPSTPNKGTGVASESDGSAQSFAAPPSDNNFVPEK